MADRNAFYQAIWAAPDDDLPRMVFADWLDEHDDPDAAAFLRLLSACRTCPPDVDKLRPLVAQLRRTMVKLPPEFIESACPVHPTVVIGPWVDVDHEANRRVLRWLRNNRQHEVRGIHRVEELYIANSTMSLYEVGCTHQSLPTITEHVSGTAACFVDGVYSLVHVWSGILLLVCRREIGDYVIRGPRLFPEVTYPHLRLDAEKIMALFGDDWIAPRDVLDASMVIDDRSPSPREIRVLKDTCEKFDPVN